MLSTMLRQSVRRICHQSTCLQYLFLHKYRQQSLHTTGPTLVQTPNTLNNQIVLVQSQTGSRAFFKAVGQHLTALNCSHVRNYTSVSSNPKPVFLLADLYKTRTAIVSQHGAYSYKDLLHYSLAFAKKVINVVKQSSPDKKVHGNFYLDGERVAILCDNDMSYVIATWAVWLLGGVAVPLSKSYPISEQEYFVDNCGASLMLASEGFRGTLEPISGTLNTPLLVMSRDDYGGDYSERENVWEADGGLDVHSSLQERLAEDGFRNKNAMIVYTSGTTGKPKGVVHTFGSLEAQIRCMVETWGWTQDDTILHVLPLHHVHGVVNVLLTSLYCGATCVMQDTFDPHTVWKTLLRKDSTINVFMAVPTIYVKLLEEYDRQMTLPEPTIPQLGNVRDVLQQKIRLMVSGSAALPQPVMRRWEEVTGHVLLERYGMTEIGMALTNPLQGLRTPGSVGQPFPGVSVRIVSYHDNQTGYDIITEADSQSAVQREGHEEESGELLVKGDNLFREYWNKPKETKDTFTDDGWFKTGDTAVYKDGTFRIVGRTSVDVIKSGAYKISALDIERHLLEHPSIQEVAIVGLPDDTWGQVIAAVIAVKDNGSLTLNELKDWSRDYMASYQIPRVLRVVKAIPRNSMGKVNKKQLVRDIFPEYLRE